ncbi:Uncharacterised protein [Escherichia coli]|uniref:Single-stranded DNA-binding protein n=1 Tax=Escherichia coli TaxID=562 RepID=A0A377BD57_ECOLX|nr:Uncharacterised protein [Escherichia coli]
MYIPQNFLPKSRQKLLRSAPGQSFPSVAVMPLAAKVLKKVMVNTGGNKRQVPQNVKTAAPETQQMMGAENQREEKAG